MTFKTISFSRVQVCDRPRMFAAGPHWTWNTVIPNYYNVWIALRGSGEMVVDGTVHPITPGTAFVFIPGQHVEGRHHAEDPIHNLAVHFHPLDSAGRRVRAREFPLAGIKARHVGLVDAVARHLARLGTQGRWRDGSGAAAWLQALLDQLTQDAREPARDPVDELIMSMAERINAHPERRTSVEALAREASLSRAHFTRRFVRVTGETPNRYQIQQRIERATQLIEQTALKMETIAEMLGYLDVYFFSRQFKAVKGFPPSYLRP